MRFPIPLRSRLTLAALVAAGALGACAPAAMAGNDAPTVSLNEATGVLTIDGYPENDYIKVSKNTYTGKVDVWSESWEPPYFFVNCDEGGGKGDWDVVCPASKVKKIVFNGGGGGDSFWNDTSLPLEAHGGAHVDFIYGGSGADTLYGDADFDHLDGRGGDDILDGGAGQDEIVGGAGSDTAAYTDATAAVQVYFDGAANDGQPGENENVPADVENATGGPYGDKLYGTPGPNQLRGGGGADTLDGLGGDDLLNGQAGDDTLIDGTGADQIYGGTETDTLSYAFASGSVTVYQDWKDNDGTAGEHDNVNMVEKLTGSPYGDDLQGTSGDDHIDGGKGVDKIDAFFGDDVILGGEDGDHIIGGPGMPSQCPNTGCTEFDTDVINGGPGSDDVDYSPRSDRLTIDLTGKPSGGFMENDKLTSIENATGGSNDDEITGNDAANSLAGFGGSDGITGGKQNDAISGGPGHDYLDGGDGNDFLDGGADDDSLNGGPGVNSIYGGSGEDEANYMWANVGIVAHLDTTPRKVTGAATDTLGADVEDVFGTSFDDQLWGSGSANTFSGWNGKDLLRGEGGDDTLEGGPGADKVAGGDGTDTVTYADHSAGVVVHLDATPTSGSPGETDANWPDIERVKGSPKNDTILGTAAPNVIDGGAGNDTIKGFGEKDLVFGGAGNDTLRGMDGADVLFPGAGTDDVDGGAGIDWVSYTGFSVPVNVTLDGVHDDGADDAGGYVRTSVENIVGGDAGDTLNGGDADNVIQGGGGGDHLVGGKGHDKLDGGAGADFLNTEGDKHSDSTACGTESDHASGEAFDTFAADCEVVTKS